MRRPTKRPGEWPGNLQALQMDAVAAALADGEAAVAQLEAALPALELETLAG